MSRFSLIYIGAFLMLLSIFSFFNIIYSYYFNILLNVNAYTILNGEYEVIEAEIIESSELINKELKNSDLPDEIRIGSIIREKEIIIPSSIYVFKKNDTVILLSKKDQLPTVENMFRISSI